jgi:GR25 family glycosyltransferase involved in LPS biosynthesis
MVLRRAAHVKALVYMLMFCTGLLFVIDMARTVVQIAHADRREMREVGLAPANKTLSCFIITLNESLEGVRLKEDIWCRPFVGKVADEEMFSHVDPEVQTDLIRGLSSRGAHYTNNKSVSIAWNHMLLWQKLLRSDGSQDLLVFEDDAIITNHSVDVYRALQSMRLFHDNYIIKLANHNGWWFGSIELSSIKAFEVNGVSHVLKKCACRTRQNLFNTGAYVLDRRAAQILLERFMPMRFHVDVFLHYTGYEFSNLFVVEDNVVELSDRVSTHQSSGENFARLWPDFKELLINIALSDC